VAVIFDVKVGFIGCYAARAPSILCWAASKQPRIASARRVGLRFNVGLPRIARLDAVIVLVVCCIFEIKKPAACSASLRPVVMAKLNIVIIKIGRVVFFASAHRASHFSSFPGVCRPTFQSTRTFALRARPVTASVGRNPPEPLNPPGDSPLHTLAAKLTQ
jgi:hypothetical protein